MTDKYSFTTPKLIILIIAVLMLAMLLFIAGGIVSYMLFGSSEKSPEPVKAQVSVPAPVAAVEEIEEPAPVEVPPLPVQVKKKQPDSPMEEPEKPKPVAVPAEYAVQTGAFLMEGNAVRNCETMEKKGYEAYVKPLDDARGRRFYTVRVEDFQKKEAAFRGAVDFMVKEGLQAIVVKADSLDPVKIPVTYYKGTPLEHTRRLPGKTQER